MSDAQHKYQEEKRKYDNLLKMQKTILADNDEYISAFLRLKNSISDFRGQSLCDDDSQLSTDQANQLVDQIVDFVKKNCRTCQCDRWKLLYKQQSEQSLKISQQKQQLLIAIQQKQEQQSLDRIQIGKLLNDYLELYRKQFCKASDQSTQKKPVKKQNRSKSKGKSVVAQTDRKATKVNEAQIKEDSNTRIVLEKLQRDLSRMHGEIHFLQQKLIQSEGLLRLYKIREIKHFISGGSLE